jgi:alpha-N-arabinofuranosidase
MDRQIAETLAVCDLVRGHKRSPKKLWLSFDEWNVWYRARSGAAVDGNRQDAPHLLEEIYNLEDALLVGGLVNTLLRNADRVKIACLAQLINVIAPIMTNDNGLFRQTIYYPYNWALQFARGRVLNVLVESPTYDISGPNPMFAGLDHVPYIDAAATINDDGETSLFVLNRDLSKPHQVEIVWEDKPGTRVIASQVLTGNDLKAVNSFDAPQRVQPQAFDKPSTVNGHTKFEVPPRSYTVIQWET